MPVPSGAYQQHGGQPSCFDKMKYGKESQLKQFNSCLIHLLRGLFKDLRLASVLEWQVVLCSVASQHLGKIQLTCFGSSDSDENFMIVDTDYEEENLLIMSEKLCCREVVLLEHSWPSEQDSGAENINIEESFSNK